MEEQQKQPNTTELDELKKQCEEYLNGWRRAKADLINYQKDEAKRFEEMMNYSREVVIGDLVPVLDSMELALRVETNNDGLQRIKIQLEDMLKKYGLEKIKVSPGDPFDASIHESVGEMEVKELESGKIAAEISSGYKLKNKVIRPARVKLSK
ncbi:MAG: nucleotide exchange factor GrpE [Candidatus Harrisonbacteria bacterium]|nr:nucleotide exchange factor GrpE [Candidatus Harrisonbacteria bacterium]